MPLDDSTWGACDEPRLTDGRRLQDMIDATPCVVIDFAIAHGRRMAESGAASTGVPENSFKDGYDFGRVEGYLTGWRARASGRAPELPEPGYLDDSYPDSEEPWNRYPGGRRRLQEELWSEWETTQDSAGRGAGSSGAQEVDHSGQQAKRQCRFFERGTCRDGDACRFRHS